jgi:hypothetical protein
VGHSIIDMEQSLPANHRKPQVGLRSFIFFFSALLPVQQEGVLAE